MMHDDLNILLRVVRDDLQGLEVLMTRAELYTGVPTPLAPKGVACGTTTYSTQS